MVSRGIVHLLSQLDSQYLPWGLTLAGLILAVCFPRAGDRAFRAIEYLGRRLAGHRLWACLSIGLAAIVLRLSLLPLLPIPAPRIHDEFSYLLGADTLAHGRLANPPHPLWIFFDTIHVNQHPTYASKYPPAQAVALALGQLLGNPWFGVLLSVGAMCAAMVWMLQGWMPPPWALLGGSLLLFRIGIFSYWMNSYWGGAVPAIGGALVAGAMPRLMRDWRARDALVLGLGAIVLANSRPLEGGLCCLPVAVVLAVRLCSAKHPSWRVALTHLILPLCMVGLAGAAFMAYFNWRSTGDPKLFPYILNERTYLAGTPSLVWNASRVHLHFANPQFEQYYNGVLRDFWSAGRFTGLSGLATKLSDNFQRLAQVFFSPELLTPLLALPWILRSWKGRFLAAQIAIVFGALLAVVWFEAHYLGPITASIFALLTFGIRYIRQVRFRGRPLGLGLSRAIVLLTVLLSPFNTRPGTWKFSAPYGISYRAIFAHQLERLPGRHLVIVRYSSQHNVFQEWVYNDADIDRAKIVWAREIPGVDLKPLLSGFSGRQIWLAEPDAPQPRISVYRDAEH